MPNPAIATLLPPTVPGILVCHACPPIPNRASASSPIPNRASASVLHTNRTYRLFLSTSISLSSVTFSGRQSQLYDESQSKSDFIVDKIEARIDSQEGQPNRLDIQEIKLTVWPSANQQTSRLITAYNQFPLRKDVTMTSSSSYRERGISVTAGYPATASTSLTAKNGKTVTTPTESVGLKLKDVQIGIQNDNQFYWKYPVSSSQPWLKESATFFNHKGTIAYPSTTPPDSIRVKASMTYGIPKLILRESSMAKLRGLISCRTFVKEQTTLFPCRQVRASLQTNILPDDRGLFNFPQDGECGFPIDIGTFNFSGEGGISTLEIQRGIEDPLRVDNLQEWMSTGTEAARGMKAIMPGTLVATECLVGREQIGEATIELDLRDTYGNRG